LETYASQYPAFLRAFSEPMVRLAFSNRVDLDRIIDALYQRVWSRLIEHHENYLFRFVQVATLLTRQ